MISNPTRSPADAIQGAEDAGIPVEHQLGRRCLLGARHPTHVGQTEFTAGRAGQRMADAGVTNTLCANQEAGNQALDQRCEGLPTVWRHPVDGGRR